MIVKSIDKLILIMIVQILSLYKDLRFYVSFRSESTMSQFFFFSLKLSQLWIKFLYTSTQAIVNL